jgi:hypothetical protein
LGAKLNKERSNNHPGQIFERVLQKHYVEGVVEHSISKTRDEKQMRAIGGKHHLRQAGKDRGLRKTDLQQCFSSFFSFFFPVVSGFGFISLADRLPIVYRSTEGKR